MLVKQDLVGHSGCKLEVIENKKGLFVIKTSKDIEYNKRLKYQYKKQKDYVGIFKTPKIIYKNIDKEGLFFFKMEYINGLKLSDYIESADKNFLNMISKKFLSIIKESECYDKNAKDIILFKIKDLKTKISPPNYAKNILNNSIKTLEKYEWSKCIKSDCHGDFTLENILVKDKELYVIDFLDSFYDSWLVDMAKAFQDLECFWSYRNYEKVSENLKTRIFTLKQLIIDDILLMKNGKGYLITIYHFLLLNLLRILPYTKDLKIEKYLYKEIDKVVKLIENYVYTYNSLRR